MSDYKAMAETLFDQPSMAAIAKILTMSDPPAIEAFRAGLIALCAHYREIVSTLPCDLPGAPFNMSLTKRIEWLEIQVIKPCERLISATGHDMRPMFSTWPYPLTVPEFRDNSGLQRELHELLAKAAILRDELKGQQEGDAGHSQEFRTEVFCAVARLLREHCPTVVPSRGVYDPEMRRRSGRYVDAMSLIFGKIIGRYENLDRLIQSEIRMPS